MDYRDSAADRLSEPPPPPYMRHDPHPRCCGQIRWYWWVLLLAIAVITIVPLLVVFIAVQNQVQSAISDGMLRISAWTLRNATNGTGFQLDLSASWQTSNTRNPQLQAFSASCAVYCLTLGGTPSPVQFPSFTAADGTAFNLSLYVPDPHSSSHTVEMCFAYILKGYEEQFGCASNTIAYTVPEHGLPAYAVNIRLPLVNLASAHGSVNYT